MTCRDGARTFEILVVASFLTAGPPATIASAQPPRALVDPANVDDDLRDELALTRMATSGEALSPCDSFSARAFSFRRPSESGMWAGEFEVVSTVPGDWFITVEGGGAKWQQRISKKGERLVTSAFSGPSVDLFLDGPGTGGPCPHVILRSELRGGQKAKPRGVVGNDDRWRVASKELRAQSDFATIESWAPSIVHLQIFDTRRGLPCTGFFITAHIVMTARHCVMTTFEAANTTVELGSTTIQGVELLVSVSELDVSLVWVDTSTPPMPLAIRPQPAAPMVLWQSPASRELLVSVIDCAVAPGGSAFFHRCDTVVGTSGAPIQDRANGAVVALHTTGCTISGQPQCVNFGTPIASIRARLAERLPLLEQFHKQAGAELREALK